MAILTEDRGKKTNCSDWCSEGHEYEVDINGDKWSRATDWQQRPSQIPEPRRIHLNEGACRGSSYKIPGTVAQFTSGSERWRTPLKFPLFISVCHNGKHLTNLTIRPTVTGLLQRRPANPKPPQETPKRMHVVNRKQIAKSRVGQPLLNARTPCVGSQYKSCEDQMEIVR